MRAMQKKLSPTIDRTPCDGREGVGDLIGGYGVKGSELARDDGAQVFVGNVVFNLQTSSGPMEIKADRVEHQLKRDPPAREAGA